MSVRPMRRRWSVAVALSVSLSFGLLAGCGGDTIAAAEPDEEVLLQGATARGPDPYTDSTARAITSPAPQPPAPRGGASGTRLRGQTLRTLSGATPGLYGGIHTIGNCDAARQTTLLHGNQAKAQSWARGAGISRTRLPGFMSELTPVVLRADTRVTSHGYRGGAAVGYQAVLQAGTAVLVDRHGIPRVRCACGNPLRPPIAAKGAVVHKGRAWAGYEPDRVVVVKPAAQAAASLVIVDVVTSTWIDRKTGSDGEWDKPPKVLPPVAPDDIYTYPPTPDPSDSQSPEEPGDPTPSADDTLPGEPTVTDCPVVPDTLEQVAPETPLDCPDQQPSDPGQIPDEEPSEAVPPPADPGVPSGEGVDPADPDSLLPVEEPVAADTFVG
ncbi:DUF6777 domain-containing protein [Streptomyces albipurpureus]|uniref:DUF6777 domain-containing protein n=1 Tax=Streptomyces albipurpureus TaxID=2897419 RepID=A0ABT0ULR0_9ACTN|nr:DUF6777 domain-containing protein [Streptomyces sp. CWNU-1]MCM2389557.1 hypothetical protein [Streptomyces sp. CWNU-1]